MSIHQANQSKLGELANASRDRQHDNEGVDDLKSLQQNVNRVNLDLHGQQQLILMLKS